MKRVFVGMSGGVDSSVAALLLQRQGYDVVGVFLRGFNVDGCQERDAEDARRVAEHLHIPFYVWDCEDEYKKFVVEYMVEGYRRGLTPNPDVMCNKEIKFGIFLQKALTLGASHVATGHYVRLATMNGKYALQAAKDKNKDQSYFLWTLRQQELRHCLFPIGKYLKSEVRQLARGAGLPTAEKKDSQGICFLGQVTLEDFLKQYIPEHPGAVVTTQGEKVGEHHGTSFYTIGQRHGLGIAASAPYYVAAKDSALNTLTVALGSEHEALYAKEAKLHSVQWSSGKPPKLPLAMKVRIRYRQPLSTATLAVPLPVAMPMPAESKQKSILQLQFQKPQKFLAAGQSAVFYDVKERVLGGGIIEA